VSIREETPLRASLHEVKRFASRMTNKSVTEAARSQAPFDSVTATYRHIIDKSQHVWVSAN